MSEVQKLNIVRVIEGLVIAVLVAVFTGYVVSNRTLGELAVELRSIRDSLQQIEKRQESDKRDIKTEIQDTRAQVEGIRRDIYRPSWQGQQEQPRR